MATTTLHPSIDAPLSVPIVGSSVPHWHALYTCARHEKYVARQLEERNIDHFLPLYRSWHMWKDRRKQVELALFPSYVFVHISMQTQLRVLQLEGWSTWSRSTVDPQCFPNRRLTPCATDWRSALRRQACRAA